MIDRSELIKHAYLNKDVLHELLFKHRHKHATKPFHTYMQHSFLDRGIAKLLYWIFRGGAKSSVAEESIILGAIFSEIKNGIIVGSNEDRASERLIAIRHEFEHNEKLQVFFGELRGHPWGDTEIVLTNGVRIMAIGQGQDLRGTKYLHNRPDFALLDDLEKREDAWTPAARAKMKQWFFGEFFPALDPEAIVRMCATPLDAEALSVTFSKLPEWQTFIVPIKYKDDSGTWRSAWEERFPLAKIEQTEQEYARAGTLPIFNREYMIQATPDEVRSFRAEDFNYTPYPRSFEAVYAIYDPARTVKDTSAHTGYAVYSWIGNKLIVWESGGAFWQPSEIISHMFQMQVKYNLVEVQVERDGLEEFIMQPLRHESAKRNIPIVLHPVKAPKGKLEFIKGLQPFFKAKEVILSGTQEDHLTLTSQLLNFPTGRIDVPNALAYAPRLRPGVPVFEDFQNDNVAPDLELIPNIPIYYAINAIVNPSVLTATLLQFHKGVLRVYTDFVAEGDITITLPQAVEHASLFIGYNAHSPLRIVLPRAHFANYDAVGLRQAVRRLPATPLQGGDAKAGRDALARAFRSTKGGRPAVQIAPQAAFLLRALAGGYASPVSPSGALQAPKAESPYTVMANGLESIFALVSSENLSHHAEDGSGAAEWAMTGDGRRYRSAMVKG